MKKALFLCQYIIQLFVGLSATVSGALLIAAPSGELIQAPKTMLAGSPFGNFLLPGIILFVINGLGQLVAALMTFQKKPFAGLTGAAFGLALMIWIFVQVNMIGGGHVLQYGYFFLGVLETVLSIMIHGNLKQERKEHVTAAA